MSRNVLVCPNQHLPPLAVVLAYGVAGVVAFIRHTVVGRGNGTSHPPRSRRTDSRAAHSSAILVQRAVSRQARADAGFLVDCDRRAAGTREAVQHPERPAEPDLGDGCAAFHRSAAQIDGDRRRGCASVFRTHRSLEWRRPPLVHARRRFGTNPSIGSARAGVVAPWCSARVRTCRSAAMPSGGGFQPGPISQYQNACRVAAQGDPYSQLLDPYAVHTHVRSG